MPHQRCKVCGAELSKDCIALNKKLLGRKIETFHCLPCLAIYLDCSEDLLRRKIEEFKEQGCSLFR